MQLNNHIKLNKDEVSELDLCIFYKTEAYSFLKVTELKRYCMKGMNQTLRAHMITVINLMRSKPEDDIFCMIKM